MEMKNTPLPLGLWVKRNAPLSSYTGTGYLEFTGNSTSSGPATVTLEFSFKINKAGLYYLNLHCARDTFNGQPSDHSNDCYVRVDGDYGAGPNADNNHGDNAPLSMLKSNTIFLAMMRTNLPGPAATALTPAPITTSAWRFTTSRQAGRTNWLCMDGQSISASTGSSFVTRTPPPVLHRT